MKKNLAKRIVLGLLTGAVLMSSSVAWAETDLGVYQTESSGGGVYEGSLTVGDKSLLVGADAQYATVVGVGAYTGGNASNSVVLGYGSTAKQSLVVSVGAGDDASVTGGPATRYIINVSDVPYTNDTCGSYAVNVNTLNDALSGYYTKDEVNAKIDAISDVGGNSGNYVEKEVIDGGGTETKLSNNFVVTDTTVGNSTTTSVTINSSDPNNPIVMDNEGITVGKNSTRIDGTGVYVWDGQPHDVSAAKASMTKDGEIKGINGTFSGNVTAANFVTSDGTNIGTKLGELDTKVQTNTYAIATKAEKTYVDDELTKKADKSALTQEVAERQAADLELKSQIDQIGSGAIAGINQRLEKTNAKINKVGAGAAALAALHPLDYDPDDKLTFSAGMGNYAGENAAALGAFYRPNEKFMLSLGGTMGNGENMVNLGLSIGLDKANGFAKMSKRELIQEVNAVKAENEAMKAEMAEMKAMLQELLAKK